MSEKSFTAFSGDGLIASGELKVVLLQTKDHLDQGEEAPVLIFEDQSGQQIDFDLRGTPEEVIARLSSHPMFATKTQEQSRTGPGRPKLGVVSREVSLLPRHWEWLEKQSGGISAGLRRLVEEARKRERPASISINAVSKFMWNMAGNRPHFEEASRALFAKDSARFRELISDWPEGIRGHLLRLLSEALPEQRQ
jgi:hypothetical protein